MLGDSLDKRLASSLPQSVSGDTSDRGLMLNAGREAYLSYVANPNPENGAELCASLNALVAHGATEFQSLLDDVRDAVIPKPPAPPAFDNLRVVSHQPLQQVSTRGWRLDGSN
jgi:hypothetical protein